MAIKKRSGTGIRMGIRMKIRMGGGIRMGIETRAGMRKME